MPIPDLSNKPGPGRPGWGPIGSYDFQFEVTGAVTIKANAAAAGDFRVSWPNGTTNTYSGDNASIAAPDATAGIVSINNEDLDDTYADEFAIVSGQTNVTKVISWGQNPWTNLSSAFLNCTNLTDISTTSLITGSGCVLSSAFKSCTSLTDVDISSWDMTNPAIIDEMFRLCTGLEVFQATNLSVNGGSRWWLRETGTAVTDGCEYRFNGLNITSTAFGASNMTQWWLGMKINPASSFANISWPSIAHAGINFQSSSITGVNSTLDCSGWTNYNSSVFPSFQSLTATEGGTSNMKIDITNLNVSTVVSFNRSFMASNVSEIVGLGGLGATNSATNMEYAFLNANYIKFDNHNLSSDFINSFNLGSSNFIQTFQACGNAYSIQDAGVPPSLHSLDLSSATALASVFNGAKFSSAPDFSNVTMSPTAAYNFTSTFSSMQVNDNSNVNSLFSKTFKVSSFSSTFQNSALPSIIIGNGVDFSPCTTMTRMFQQTSSSTNIELPTNMDLGNLTGVNSFQYFILFGSTLSTCQVDNFIRRLHATALTNGLAIDFEDGALTESPAIVQSLKDELVSNGWSITTNTTDATLPFAYPSYSFDSEVTQSVTPTTVPTGGVFSSTDPGVTVNASTGAVSWANTFMGTPTIRCTYTNGCYNEVQMSMLITTDNNYSMLFDGTSSYFDTTSSTVGQLQVMSVSAWFKETQNAATNTTLVANNGSTNKGWAIWIDGTKIRWQVADGTGSLSWTETVLQNFRTYAPLNQWNHICCTFDGSYSKIYINGVLRETWAATPTPYVVDYSGNVGNLIIGRRSYSNAGFFRGRIDEVGVFPRALTPAQIKLIYDANSTNKSIKLSSLPGGAPVAWYRMGD